MGCSKICITTLYVYLVVLSWSMDNIIITGDPGTRLKKPENSRVHTRFPLPESFRVYSLAASTYSLGASTYRGTTIDWDTCTYMYCLFRFFLTLLLSSLWTSRGNRCRPFSPLVIAFNFYRA